MVHRSPLAGDAPNEISKASHFPVLSSSYCTHMNFVQGGTVARINGDRVLERYRATPAINSRIAATIGSKKSIGRNIFIVQLQNGFGQKNRQETQPLIHQS